MTQSDERKFDPKMLEALVCPQCQGRLSFDAEAQELISAVARLAYPIRGGIPVLLIDEARVINED
ncbi:Trm112 family protein [Octadecabacter ascidiaceicola]|uniref:UPF0434 protein OCA8868_02636 n=1 Tax=Octadecabacter ascidiaceicola TaxID=1655543 RepID=A0A238KGU4_9RHOB|nr:Trm112 family protein [Octadecabacter ascidiaceicola]SMX42033.1 hypothetical protein OCA8868_02636 [Octadecabacter ascidiaceicola]